MEYDQNNTMVLKRLKNKVKNNKQWHRRYTHTHTHTYTKTENWYVSHIWETLSKE